ncbi:hypothetical protein THAOC_28260 [Thalassiosira oceanica]|uniref:Uncharacterized protein n=1 Tax=Thalassiosira oceanica TaxID=159749 RepID=K0RFE9_THAOC|nr:hypothetical protein THAOC_28260 [Thalassiosira oceanica]|eukprot:EJK52458.1 hypothetical protein THAOC_28260 [Thalassiosira oceanica]
MVAVVKNTMLDESEKQEIVKKNLLRFQDTNTAKKLRNAADEERELSSSGGDNQSDAPARDNVPPMEEPAPAKDEDEFTIDTYNRDATFVPSEEGCVSHFFSTIFIGARQVATDVLSCSTLKACDPETQPVEILPEALAAEASDAAREILEKTAPTELETAPTEVRDEYYKNLSKAAITHAEIERKRAELELKKLEFESRMIDEDVDDLGRESSESSGEDDQQSQDEKCPDGQLFEIIPDTLATEASDEAEVMLDKTVSAASIALEKAPAEVRDEYYKALSKTAITHAEIERKKAELELKKLEFECRMIDEDIEDLDH